MSMLSLLFEEDIDMQDALDDADNIADENEDTIIGVFEDRAKDDKVHLFDNEVEPDYELEDNVEKLLDDSEMENIEKTIATDELNSLIDNLDIELY